MLGIVKNEIEVFNGLGANGENLQNWMPLINAGVSAGTQIAQTAIQARNDRKTQTTIYGGNPSTYTPTVYTPTTTNTTTTSTEKKDLTPWLIGAAVVVVGGAIILMNNKSGRR